MAASPVPYDLTHIIAPFLDRHLLFPLLEFLQKGRCDEKHILEVKHQLVLGTKMLDFQTEIYKELTKDHTSPEQVAKKEEMLQKIKDRRESIVAAFSKHKQEAAPMLRVLDGENPLAKTLKQNGNFTMQYLESHENVTPASLEALYRYAKFQFDCGNYNASAGYLYHYRALSTNADRNFSALWGKFAAEILMGNWEIALADLNTLREAIDTRNFGSPVLQLQQRTWFIHWSLFVFFNHPSGRNLIVDMFLQDRYLNAIQTTCPHILRYLTAAVITNKKRRNVLKDLVKVIQQENYVYRDPITEFIECLYINFDFEGAQQKLRECEKVLQNDFFLVACRDEFVENARLFIFETYCRIHQVIDISMLAEKLNMDQVAAEKWIVNLIRNARLDAKIDSAKNHVIMGTQNPSVYQQVIEKTKGLAFRSYVMANNITQLNAAQ